MRRHGGLWKPSNGLSSLSCVLAAQGSHLGRARRSFVVVDWVELLGRTRLTIDTRLSAGSAGEEEHFAGFGRCGKAPIVQFFTEARLLAFRVPQPGSLPAGKIRQRRSGRICEFVFLASVVSPWSLMIR